MAASAWSNRYYSGRSTAPEISEGQILIKLMAASEPNGSEARGPPTSSAPRSTGKWPVCSMILRASACCVGIVARIEQGALPARPSAGSTRITGVEMVECLDDARALNEIRGTPR